MFKSNLPKRLNKRIQKDQIDVRTCLEDVFRYRFKGVSNKNMEKYIFDTGRYSLPIQALMLAEVILFVIVTALMGPIYDATGSIGIPVTINIILMGLYGIGQLKCNDLVDHCILYRGIYDGTNQCDDEAVIRHMKNLDILI